VVHVSLDERLMDKLAAQAIVRGHSMGDEIARRLDQSFGIERAEPREWR
jgi:hypothetical protein